MTSPLASDQCTWRGSHDYKVTVAVFPCWCNYSYKPRSYRSRNLLSWHCSGTMGCCLSLKQKSGEKFRFLQYYLRFQTLTPYVPRVININFLPTVSIYNQEKRLWELINPFTAKFSQKQISTKCPNFILWNFEKQIAPCVSTGRELSFEWSYHRISSTDSKEFLHRLKSSSTDSKVTVTLQNSIKHPDSESVRGSPEGKRFDF